MWVIPHETDPLYGHEDLVIRTNDYGKDGYTVKKFIALLLVVAFVCANTVGCGTPSSAPKAPTTGTGDKKDVK